MTLELLDQLAADAWPSLIASTLELAYGAGASSDTSVQARAARHLAADVREHEVRGLASPVPASNLAGLVRFYLGARRTT